MKHLAFAFLALLSSLAAQEKYPPMHRLTWEEYAGTLAHWRKTYPKVAVLESRGMSGQNMPVYLLKITDATVKNTDKQVCLMTTLHSGPERTGTTGAMAFAEWCLSDDPLAVETRKQQIVLIMPCVNPLAMFYALPPDIQPDEELAAVQSVINEHRPQVQMDLHEAGLQEARAEAQKSGQSSSLADRIHGLMRAGWMPPAEVRKLYATDKSDATPATFVDVAYSPHFRQTMDVWLAKSAKPTPVVFYIHGGGWGAQDKTDIHQHLDVRAFLDAGIAVASINYRFLADANAAKVSPPLQWPLQDAARALQHLRSKAAEWNLDKTRIAASGVSAGGCSSLWLAMHDDMADPKSSDPIARESTRLIFTVTKAPQPSLDPKQLVEWIPNSEYGGHAFGYFGKTRKKTFAPFLANRDKHLDDLRRYSPMSHASADDPPAFILCTKDDKPLIKGEAQKDPTHSALLGLMMQDTLKPLGVNCEVRHPLDGQPTTTMQEMLLQQFKTEHP
ncbi:alpha/beta hydrolase fold domain-containing protein [Prosthecobacter sp.]|uniref:alpha/beta hydrolase fold domain-containing protein n=1 Tax=Prosthecobacter sp. TaxID=1965333 RepID=UPI002ABB1E3B|nr:alpha/beta hydrolase fold domain-containing protein [Prosthecobacter sp.]MDZ4402638.1 alpha/beta hydrolase fold domain-containing protein [Prosthecobacter sp.]